MYNKRNCWFLKELYCIFLWKLKLQLRLILMFYLCFQPNISKLKDMVKQPEIKKASGYVGIRIMERLLELNLEEEAV